MENARERETKRAREWKVGEREVDRTTTTTTKGE